MNRSKALCILEGRLAHYRTKTWDELHALVEDGFVVRNTHYEEVVCESGSVYQIRINVYWDDKRRQHLRVVGAIDDGGWRAFVPHTSSFIVDSKGHFFDE